MILSNVDRLARAGQLFFSMGFVTLCACSFVFPANEETPPMDSGIRDSSMAPDTEVPNWPAPTFVLLPPADCNDTRIAPSSIATFPHPSGLQVARYHWKLTKGEVDEPVLDKQAEPDTWLDNSLYTFRSLAQEPIFSLTPYDGGRLLHAVGGSATSSVFQRFNLVPGTYELSMVIMQNSENSIVTRLRDVGVDAANYASDTRYDCVSNCNIFRFERHELQTNSTLNEMDGDSTSLLQFVNFSTGDFYSDRITLRLLTEDENRIDNASFENSFNSWEASTPGEASATSIPIPDGLREHGDYILSLRLLDSDGKFGPWGEAKATLPQCP